MSKDQGKVIPLKTIKKKAPAKKAGAKRRASKFRQMWGDDVAKAGFTQVPFVILERQQALGLDAVDMNILLQLLRFWWEPGRHPFPSKATIAECIGCTTKTVQRHLRDLERGGLIHRDERIGSSNVYRLDGLIAAVQKLSREALKERQKREEKARARAQRKRPLTA